MAGETRGPLLDVIEDVLDSLNEGGKLPETMVMLTDTLKRAADDGDIDASDQEVIRLKSLWEKSRRLYNASQRAYFRDEYAPEIVAHDGHYWRFPYTEVSYALIAYELNHFARITDDEATSDETGITKNRWEQFKKSYASVLPHFEKVLETIEDGTFVDDDGKEPIHVERTDESVRIDISPVISKLAENGFESIDIFGEWGDYPLGAIEVEREEVTDKDGNPIDQDVLGEFYFMPDNWADEGWIIVKDLRGVGDSGLAVNEYGLLDPNNDALIPFDPCDYFGFYYLTMYALVSLLDCRKSIYSIVYPQKRRRRKSNVTTKQVVMPNDAITNAFFGRESNAIQPWDYFNHDTSKKALSVATSNNGHANVVVIHDAETTIDAAIETYRMTPEDRFWLEAICSLARDGYTVISGSDLLKFNGYQNPYQTSARDTMRRAYQSVRKMHRMRIAIDTTKENSKRYPNLAKSYDEQPLVDCGWRVMRFDDESLDFEITLNLTKDGTPLGALPLAVYARDKKQLLLAKRTDFEFKTIGKLTLEHRLMWRYVLRRMKDKTTSPTIVFDTIFKNIGLENVDRQKRSKMLTVLHKMLDERKKDGTLTFTWNRDKNGRAEYSVTIRPKAGTSDEKS